MRFTPLLLAALAACSREAPRAAHAVADDFGDTIAIGAPPRRIVSLNPTATQLIYAIGAGSRLVGRTMWDTSPDEVRAVADLGPGIRPNVEAVLAVKPDLVLLYASADNHDAARRFRAAGITTASYKVDRIADFERVTLALGRLTGDTAAARRTVDSTLRSLARVREATRSLPPPTVVWPLWESPLLVVGGGSYLNELLGAAGARNVYGALTQPSPTVSIEDLVRRDPDIVLVNPASRARILADPKWRTLRAVREGRLLPFDTTIVNGPTASLGRNAAGLARLFHPGLRL